MRRYDEPPKEGPISSLYAAIATNPEGEGIVGMMTTEGWLPLIVTDRRLLELDEVLGQCQAIADSTGHPIRVMRFERSAIVGEFRPGGPT